MTKIRFWLKNFKLNIFQNLFMILQLFLLFIFVNVTVSDLIYNNSVINYIPNYKENKYFLSGATSLNIEFSDDDGFFQLVKELEQIKGVQSVGYQIEESVIVDEQLMLCFYLNDGMADIQYPLHSGKWFDHSNRSDGVILGGNIANKYKIGEKIQIEHVTYENGELVHHPLTVTVIGKLKNPAYIVNLNYTSTKPDVTNLLDPYDNVVLTLNPNLLSSEAPHYPLGSLMVTLEDKNVPSELLNYGQCHSLIDIQENSKAILEKTLRERIPATCTLLAAVLFGLIGTVYLYIHKSMKILSIYYLNGFDKRSIQAFVFLLNFFCIFISFLGSGLVLSLPSFKNFLLGNAYLGVGNLIVSLFIILFTSLLSFLFSSILIRKNPITTLRRFE